MILKIYGAKLVLWLILWMLWSKWILFPYISLPRIRIAACSIWLNWFILFKLIYLNVLDNSIAIYNCGCLVYTFFIGCLCSSTLGPHLVGPRFPKYCKNKFMTKAYNLFTIFKTYLERPSYGVQNKWKGFSSQ